MQGSHLVWYGHISKYVSHYKASAHVEPTYRVQATTTPFLVDNKPIPLVRLNELPKFETTANRAELGKK